MKKNFKKVFLINISILFLIDFIDKAGSNSLKILFLFDDINLLIAIGQLFPSNQIFPFNFLSFFEKKLISKNLTFGSKFSTKSFSRRM